MKIIAHRGASGHAPDNTIKAIQQALLSAADGIEIDVYLNNSTELIVTHERWLQRTTNGFGCVQSTPMDQILTFDAGDGEKIPTLWQILTLVSGKCEVNIELKGTNTARKTIDILHRATQDLNFSYEQFLISSFNHHLLKEVHQLMPSLKLGALTASLPIHYAAFAEEVDAFAVCVDVDFISTEFVHDAHSRHLKIYAYTVNEPEDIETLYKLQVDGIFTNYPNQAAEIIDSLMMG